MIFGFKENKCKGEAYTAKEVETIISDLGLGGQCKLISGDLNTACGDVTGFYRGRNLTNAPSESREWIYVIQLIHDENYKKQIALDLFNNKTWERTQIEGVWRDWTNTTAEADVVTKGDFAVVTGSVTLEGGSAAVRVDFPVGFTPSNSVIISCGRDYTGQGFVNGTLAVQTELMAGLNATQNKIEIVAYDPEASNDTVSYKIVLMKI